MADTDILEIFDGYQLARQEIIGQRKIGEEGEDVKKTFFFLLKDGKIVRVWRDKSIVGPREIALAIAQVEEAEKYAATLL